MAIEETNRARPPTGRAALTLALVGIVLIALPFVVLRGLSALGVSLGSNSAIGVMVINAVGGGALCVIVGLILALKNRPGWLIGAGAALLCLGSGPLLSVIVAAKLGLTADPNPNPVLFGILAMFTLLPALVLLVGGVVALVLRRARPS